MDIGWFRSMVTVVLFIAFIGIVLWAWSSRRRDDFEAASRLVFDENKNDDDAAQGGGR